ncbi:MAG: secretin N-terminal domain-containing protein [Planctomycetota bacterium]
MTILLFLWPLTARAQQHYAPDKQSISKTARQRLRTKITYSCVDLPIETVLMNLADQASIDIVKSPKVTGKVTVKVTEVPLEEALTNILAAHDYTYIATNSMIRVVPLPEITALREQLITRIYRVTYADANEIAMALTSFVSDRGKIALNKGTSHIMVTDTESKIKAIDKFIQRIDLITPQVLVEVRIYDITSSEGFELGAEWTAGRNTPLKTTDHTKTRINTDFPTSLTETTTTQTGDVTTTTTMPDTSTTFEEHRRDLTDYYERVQGNYENSDNPPGFMDTERDIEETRNEDSTTTYSGFTETETIKTGDVIETQETQLPLGTFFDTTTERYTTRRRKPFVGASFDRIQGGSLRFSLLNDAVDIDLALSLLSKQVEAKLLANPRVLVLDNETANFEIIREIPYRELLQVARQDPITYTEFKNVGVDLEVTPHIARDGMIRLRIAPEFSVVVGLNPEGAPTVDTRRANTTALIRDGQTIAMGGLRKRETSKAISKVPLLGDLPLLGGLFKSETESIEVNELVVFITTRIITEPVLSEVEKRQFSQTDFAGPKMTKLRLERNGQPKPEDEEPRIADALDLLLKKLESPRR